MGFFRQPKLLSFPQGGGGSSLSGVTNPSEGSLVLAPTNAATIPLTINLAAAHSANAINVTSNGGSAGDLFNISKDGFARVGPTGSPLSVPNLGLAGTPTSGVAINSNSFIVLDGGTPYFALIDYSTTGAYLNPASIIGWTATSIASGNTDVAIARHMAGILKTTDGTNTTGVLPSVGFVTVQSDVTLNNNNSAQSIFPAASDTLTVAALTTYMFEAEYFIATGTTTHTTATGFAGTATLTNINYLAQLWSVTDGTINTTAPSVLRVTTANSTVLNATSAAPFTIIRLKGIIRVNAGGTIIPQITFSAGPSGTNLGKVNSYFRLFPVGSNTVESVGRWA